MTMTTRTAERLDDWESRPFTDGYEGLRTLADQSFSGAVTAGRATLYMLNGAVVGVLDGTIEDFEDATGTIYEAPTPALPLLAVMQEWGDEVRAKYYSEETPLSEADQKLTEGGFTGYVELSENVLSGDYYVVYHGGKSMSVAYVGESEKLITGDEAFEQADEEVGIYKVRPVDVEPIEIPEPEPEDDAGEAETETTATAASDEPEPADDTESSSPESESQADDTATESDRQAGSDQPATEQSRSEPQSWTEPSEGQPRDGAAQRDRAREASQPQSAQESEARQTTRTSAATEQTEPRNEPSEQSRHRSDAEERPSRREGPARDQERAEQPRSRETDRPRDRDRADTQNRDRTETRDRDRADTHTRDRSEPRDRQAGNQSRRGSQGQGQQSDPLAGEDIPSGGSGTTADETTGDGGASSDEPAELEHRTIPSVDPDRTWTADDGDSQSTSARTTSRNDAVGGGAPPESTSTQGTEPPSQQSGQHRSDVTAKLEDARVEITDLEKRIEDLQQERADLEAAREDLEAERADLQSELERVRSERDDLQAEVEHLHQQVSELEERLEQAGSETPATTTAETTLSAREAIDGTNLFVRYESKGEATLKSAHDGSADAEAVNENLNLEYHTQFDTDETAIEGKPYDEFLLDTIHYRFVSWVVRELLYEIRDTGHEDALADLYDALPRIDRAELNASISITYTEDGEEQRTQETFDVVLRDRMGNPLVVTNLNDSRQAATDEMMTTLVTTAKRVGESSEKLSGAFFVTSSFFDPDALETASEATGGGILSRDKRESFVRLSRKDGFHLCLVESRDGDFHLAVPEL